MIICTNGLMACYSIFLFSTSPLFRALHILHFGCLCPFGFLRASVSVSPLFVSLSLLITSAFLCLSKSENSFIFLLSTVLSFSLSPSCFPLFLPFCHSLVRSLSLSLSLYTVLPCSPISLSFHRFPQSLEKHPQR